MESDVVRQEVEEPEKTTTLKTPRKLVTEKLLVHWTILSKQSFRQTTICIHMKFLQLAGGGHGAFMNKPEHQTRVFSSIIVNDSKDLGHRLTQLLVNSNSKGGGHGIFTCIHKTHPLHL